MPASLASNDEPQLLGLSALARVIMSGVQGACLELGPECERASARVHLSIETVVSVL